MARKQRGRGEGSIFPRDDRWVAEVSLGYDGNGKRKRKTVYGASKREVQEKLDRLRSEARAGVLPDAGSLTVGQLLDRWLEKVQAGGAAQSYETRESVVRNHLLGRLGRLKLSALNALHVEGLYADLRRDGVGAHTVRAAADVLGMALGMAVKLKLLKVNPAAAVDKPKVPKRDMLFLTDPQSRGLRQVAAGTNLAALVAAALGTGCRQGELLALGWADIDLKAGRVEIRKSLAKTKAGFALKEPKTKAGRRAVRLPAFAVAALEAHRRAALAAGRIAAPVFCTRTGGYLDKKNVLRAFRGVIRQANKAGHAIPPALRFHDMRHTVASLLLSKGHSLRAVSQRLGHANPAMTLRVYAHCLPTDDETLAEGLERMIG